MTTAVRPQPAGTGDERRSAAFFDLDRTLLAGASGPVLGAALREAGLVSGSTQGIESVMFKVFDVIGETYPSMIVSRQGARVARGWPVALVRDAARKASGPLADAVLPYARQLIEEHRDAGRLLVMATTTPADLIRPLAERLGFDAVVATTYGVRDGHYDGTIDGEFVWGKGKARAVSDWVMANDVDLLGSYAYSDSWYDTPLLSIVGNPTVVNPDPRMIGMATLRRWPMVHFDVPAGVPKFAGIEPQRALFLLAQPQLLPWVRFDLGGLDRLPSDGPAILVGNHRSYLDPLAIGYALARKGRPVRFLGKKEVFDAPIVGDLATALGGIRVDRGTGSDAPLHAAEEALAAGEMVAIMPQGTIPRGPAFFDPELTGRWGAVRLAHATGVPIIPIGLWGTEHAWPRSAKFPDVTNLLNPPTVRIRIGDPVPLGGDDVEADTATMMAAIVDLLPAEARKVRTPTVEELAQTYPGGVIPTDDDVTHERDRRPGHD
ncbi:MAG TPA: HAD-IB family hydrolase [Microthrixaceae bacterium]|nr:HAD-IB family hydrolase [Microthrixaceae bacterium]